MLFTANILKRIPTGEVTLAFRRWRRSSVKTNGSMKTGVGVLAIERVEKISEDEITEADAVNAGYADRHAVVEEFQGREGELYRIAFSYRGEDPRIQQGRTTHSPNRILARSALVSNVSTQPHAREHGPDRFSM